MTEAEVIFQGLLSRLQERVAVAWKGREREAALAIIRSANLAVFLRRFLSGDEEQSLAQWNILSGIASALAVILPTLKGTGGGMPWGPTNPSIAAWVDAMLFQFGQISDLARLASLERYGLANVEKVAPGELRIEVKPDLAEATDRDASYWLRSHLRSRFAALRERANDSETVAKLLDATSDVHNGWFIRYGDHDELLDIHQDLAMSDVLAYPESEMLPHEAMIGGRLFAEWRAVCVAAHGRLLNHVSYASRLQYRYPALALRDLLTVYALKKDVREVWLEAGDDKDRVKDTLSHITLDADSLKPWQEHFEIPLPFYVDIGKKWVVMPLFGGLLNPCAGLVRTLRHRHGREWDAAVARRETYFRHDLLDLFPPPRYIVPQNGFTLRRTDGSILTDVDATVIDTETGALALIQLKWQDVFGRSPRERESRRRNLLNANEWVERVSAWLDGRSAARVGTALGLTGVTSSSPPVLIVVARYMARFTRNDLLDARAAWVSWPELARMRIEEKGLADPIGELFQRFRAGGTLTAEPGQYADRTYTLPDLTVHVVIN